MISVEVLILERAEVHPAKRALYSVTIPDAKVSCLYTTMKGGHCLVSWSSGPICWLRKVSCSAIAVQALPDNFNIEGKADPMLL